jgi:Carbohydrate family 9 binding domain-like
MSNEIMHCGFVKEDFKPDGDLGKDVWNEASWIRFNHGAFCGTEYPQSETRAAAAWSPANIYFAFICRYLTLNTYEGEDPAQERWELWDRDVVEVFINPTPDCMTHYYEFEVSPNNQWIDLEIDKTKNPFYHPAWSSGFTHATRIDVENHVWTCEMCIPLTSMLAGAPQPGAEWRLNLYRADGPSPPSQRRLMSWVTIPGGDTFHTPSRFGVIRFMDSSPRLAVTV